MIDYSSEIRFLQQNNYILLSASLIEFICNINNKHLPRNLTSCLSRKTSTTHLPHLQHPNVTNRVRIIKSTSTKINKPMFTTILFTKKNFKTTIILNSIPPLKQMLNPKKPWKPPKKIRRRGFKTVSIP